MISTIIVIAYVVVKHFMSYVDVYAETVVISAFDDCYISGKAVHLAENVYDSMVTIKVGKDMRSRYAKYIYYNYPHVRICKQRDRKPSRLPVRTLNRQEKKSKKLRDINSNGQKHFLTAKTPTLSRLCCQPTGGHCHKIYLFM